MIKELPKKKYISLVEASKLSSYSQEYLSLRARQGKLKAVKVGRDWMTTKDWLNEYANAAQMNGKNKNKEKLISLQEAAKLSPYSQQYLSLRVRQGKLRAVKLGRNWTTTQEWLNDYISQVKRFEQGKIVSPQKTAALAPTKVEGVVPTATEKVAVQKSLPVAVGLKEKDYGLLARVGFALENGAAWLRGKTIPLYWRFKALEEDLRRSADISLAPRSFASVRAFQATLVALAVLGVGVYFAQGSNFSEFKTKAAARLVSIGETTTRVVEKIGEAPAAVSEKFIAWQKNLPAKIILSADKWQQDAIVSAKVLGNFSRDIFKQSASAPQEIIWQVRQLAQGIEQGRTRFLTGIDDWSNNLAAAASALPQQTANLPFVMARYSGQVAEATLVFNEKLNGKILAAVGQIDFAAAADNLNQRYSSISEKNEWLKQAARETLVDNFKQLASAVQKCWYSLAGIGEWPSLAYDYYQKAAWTIGQSIVDAPQNIAQAFYSRPSPTDFFRQAGWATLDVLDRTGGRIKSALVRIGRGIGAVKLSAGNRLDQVIKETAQAANLIGLRLTSYGQLAEKINNFHDRLAAYFFLRGLAPQVSVSGNPAQLTELAEQVVILKTELAQLKQTPTIIKEVTKEVSRVVNVQNIQHILPTQTITQMAASTNASFATPADLVSLENRLSSLIGKVQTGVLQSANYYTTNNIYSMASAQKIDQLYAPTIYRGITFSGGAVRLTDVELITQSGSGQVSFSGNVDALAGLDVSGDLVVSGGGITTTGQLVTTGTATSTIAGDVYFDTDTLIVDSLNNRIGIATSSPFTTFSVVGNTYLDGTLVVSGLTDFTSTGTTTFGGPIASRSGNLIVASAGTTNNLLFNPYGGNIGIGTSSPWGLLSVNANGLVVGTPQFVVGSSTATNLIVANGGNVGIGTSSPAGELTLRQRNNGDTMFLAVRRTDTAPSGDFISYQDVAGTALFRVDNSGNVYQGGIISSGSLTVTSVSTPQLRIQRDATNEMTFTVGATGATSVAVNGTAPSLTFVPQSNSVNTYSFTDASSNSILSIDTTSSRVGIGTTTPNWLLSVSGTRPSLALSDYSASANLKHWLISSMGGNLYVGTSTDSYATSTPAALTILNNGNVGIGTSTPWGLLSVNANGLVAGTPQFVIGSSTATNFIVTNNGNVGIGTAGPVIKLDVSGRLRALNSTETPSSGAGLELAYYNNLYGEVLAYDRSGSVYLPLQLHGLNLSLKTNGTERVGIDSSGNFYVNSNQLYITQSSGNVGIGTTTPNQLFSLYSSAADAAVSFGNSNATMWTMGTDISDGSKFKIASSSALGTNDRLTIDTNGNIGIGTTSLASLLNIAGATAPKLTLSDTDATNNQKHWFIESDTGSFNIGTTSDALATNATYRALTILNNGNVGIGTTSPPSMLTVGGNANIYGNLTLPTITEISLDSVYRDLVLWNRNTNQLEKESGMYMYYGWLHVDSGGLQVVGDTILDDVYSRNGQPLLLYPRLDAAGENLKIIPDAASTNAASGSNDVVNILPTYAQSGTAGSTDLKINRVETTLGSGTHRFADFQVSGVSKFYVDNTGGVFAKGSVGIGTTSPYSLLSISNSVSTAVNTPLFTIASTTAGTATSTLLTVLASGNIGIGTAAPGAKLNVEGNILLGNATWSAKRLDFSDSNWGLETGGPVEAGWMRWNFYDSATRQFGIYDTNSQQYRLVVQNGNIGIGTTSPYATLSVAGRGVFDKDIRFDYFTATSTTATSTISTGGFVVGTNQFVVQQTSGNVGIGTAAPTNKLDVIGGDVIIGLAAVAGSRFKVYDNTAGRYAMALDQDHVDGYGVVFNNDTNSASIPLFNITHNNMTQSAIYIQGSGNVGIGTAVPIATLHVAGATAAADDSTHSVYFTGATADNVTDASGNHSAIYFNISSGSGSSGLDKNALRVRYTAGWTGARLTTAAVFQNQVAGVSTDWFGNYGNLGALSSSEATTVGTNVGSLIQSLGGNINIGAYGKAVTAKDSAANIGVIGHGRNTGASPTQIGGFFTLSGSSPTFESAALIADNSDQTSPIFLARDNGTSIFGIYDGGNVGIGTTTPNWLLSVSGTRPSLALSDYSAGADSKHWLLSSMGGNLYVGTSTDSYATSTPAALTILNNGNVGVGTAAPGIDLDIGGGTYTWNGLNLNSSGPGIGVTNTAARASIALQTITDSAFGSFLHLSRTRANYGAIQDGDELGQVNFNAYVGSSFQDAAAIRAIVSGTPGGSYNTPAALIFQTSANSGQLGSVERMRITSTGNVGIGSTTPGYKLSVAGSGYFDGGTITASGFTATSSITAPYFTANSASATSTFAGGLAIETSGLVYDWQTDRVGIGTASPAATLHVAGAASAADSSTHSGYFGGSTASSVTDGSGLHSAYLFDIDSGTGSAGLYKNAVTIKLKAGWTGAQFTSGLYVQNAVAATGANLVGGAANVGYYAEVNAVTTGYNIGTWAYPSGGNLNLGFFGRAITAKNSATNIGAMGLGRNTGTSPIQIGGYFGMNSADPTFESAALLADNSDQTSPIFLARDNGTSVFGIYDGGNVGIGTTTPASLLNIASTLPRFYLSDTDFATNGHWFLENNAGVFSLGTTSSALAVSDTRALSITNTGDVGIGITSPASKLDVVQAAGITEFRISSVNSGSANKGQLSFYSDRGTGNEWRPGYVLASDNNDFTGVLSFYTNGTGSANKTGSVLGLSLVNGLATMANASSTQLTTTGSTYLATTGGNVGIGTTSPLAKLAIKGSGATTGRLLQITDSGDVEKVTILDNGNVGIGTTGPYTKLDIGGGDSTWSGYDFHIGKDNGIASLVMTATGNSADSKPFLVFGKYRGTYANKTTLSVGDKIADFYFEGYTDSRQQAAQILVEADTGWGATGADSPGRITFWTTPDGSGTVQERVRINNSGNVGIGTTSPWGLLSVNANGLVAGTPQFVVGSSTATNFIVTNGGNVGIGTSSPTEKLSVNGAIDLAPITAPAATTDKLYNVAGDLFWNGANVALPSPTATYTLTGTGSVWQATSTLVIAPAGNVGIGTTSPYSLLSISNSASTAVNTPLFTIASTTAGTATSTLLTVLANGNVGVGTMSPTGLLTVYNSSDSDNAKLKIGKSTAADYSIWRDNTTGFLNFDGSQAGYIGYVFNNGNVGIGTTSPQALLHIRGTGDAALRIERGGAGSPIVDFYDGATLRSEIGWNPAGSFYIYHNGAERLSINDAGYVSMPGGHGADYAETMLVEGTVKPGNIIAVDRTFSKHGILSQGNSSLLGVVSTRPSIVIDSESGFQVGFNTKETYNNEKAPVALGGRVPVIVSSENGLVAAGNRIAASDIPGVGQKATQIGQTVGVALEDFALVENCPAVNSVDEISWPIDESGENIQKPCFKLPDGVYIGKVVVWINNSLADSESRLVGLTEQVIVGDSGNVGIGTSSPSTDSGIKLAVGGDIAATGFVNLSTREAKRDIEYLSSADYEQALAKISGVRVATYYYNDDETYGTNGTYGSNGTYGTYGSNDLTGGKRLGLIAEEAPLEVLSADGRGVDLYKLASFTLMGVKALGGEVISVKSEAISLEARMATLESAVASGALNAQTNFNQALETLTGETIELSQSSVTALVNSLYSSVLQGLRNLGVIVEQGIVKVQKLVADVLQINKLVVNTAPQTDNFGQTKDATIGSSQINVGELNTYIMNNQVGTTTKIFVTPEQPVALGICEITAEPRGTDTQNYAEVRPQGFRVCMNATSSQIVKFNWWIVETISDPNATNYHPNDPNLITSTSSSPGPSPSVSVSPSASPSVSPSASPSVSPSVSPSPSVSSSPSPEATPIASETPTPSASPSVSPEPSPSESPSISPEPSPSETPAA